MGLVPTDPAPRRAGRADGRGRARALHRRRDADRPGRHERPRSCAELGRPVRTLDGRRPVPVGSAPADEGGRHGGVHARRDGAGVRALPRRRRGERRVRRLGPVGRPVHRGRRVLRAPLRARSTGREAIRTWITATMAEFPNNEMTEFPAEWWVIDEEQGLGRLRGVEPHAGPRRRRAAPGDQLVAAEVRRATTSGPTKRTSTRSRSSPT